MADRVIVIYAGRKVEEAPVRELLRSPKHPYTLGLLGAMPRLGDTKTQTRLTEIPGTVPSLMDPIVGCAFAPRCSMASDKCRVQAPKLRSFGDSGHLAACWHSESIGVPR